MNTLNPTILRTRFLNAFEGRWETEGHTFNGVFGPSCQIKGSDTYEWMAGNHFLIHKVDVVIGRDKVEALEVIGYDATTNSYPVFAFDNQGNSSRYEARLENEKWYFKGISERAIVIISSYCIRATWERLHDTKWLPWMEIELKKSS